MISTAGVTGGCFTIGEMCIDFSTCINVRGEASWPWVWCIEREGEDGADICFNAHKVTDENV